MMKILWSIRNRYFLISIGILLMILGAAVGFFIGHGDKSSNPEKPVLARPQANDSRTFFWEIYPDLVITTTGQKINRNITLLDSNDVSRSFFNVSKDFPLLVFRYSKFDCQACVKQVLNKLTKLFAGNEERVCILVDGYDARELRITYGKKALKFPIYILESENLGLSLENKNLPFLFLLENSQLSVNRVFVPFKEYAKQTDVYLEHMHNLMTFP